MAVTSVVVGSSIVVVAVAAVVPASVVVGGASVVVTTGQSQSAVILEKIIDSDYKHNEMFYRMVVSERYIISPTKTPTHQTLAQFQNCSDTPRRGITGRQISSRTGGTHKCGVRRRAGGRTPRQIMRRGGVGGGTGE